MGFTGAQETVTSTDLVPVIIPVAATVVSIAITAIEKIIVAWIKRRQDEGGENEDE